MRVTVTNHGPEARPIHVLPTLWFRDTWTGGEVEGRPHLSLGDGHIVAEHPRLGRYRLHAHPAADGTAPEPLFCNNATNETRIWGTDPVTRYPKDGINDHVVSGAATVDPEHAGTKAAWWYRADVAPGETVEFVLRLEEWLADDEAAPTPARFAGGPRRCRTRGGRCLLRLRHPRPPAPPRRPGSCARRSRG